MNHIREQVDTLKKLFRDRLTEGIQTVRLRDLYPDDNTFGDADVWSFKPMDAAAKERVTKLFLDGKYVEAQLESIISRGVEWDAEKNRWTRLFAPSMKSDFMQWDPEFIDELAARIGARWVDVMPTEAAADQDPEKNFD